VAVRELALSARPIIDQYFRRTKFMETEAVRQELYDEGHPVPRTAGPRRARGWFATRRSHRRG
jgi:hypothetical protein